MRNSIYTLDLMAAVRDAMRNGRLLYGSGKRLARQFGLTPRQIKRARELVRT